MTWIARLPKSFKHISMRASTAWSRTTGCRTRKQGAWRRSSSDRGPEYTEESRATLGWRLLDELHVDVGYALRALRSNPGFALAATLTLALGIAANVTVFTAVNAALVRDLPFERPDRVVSLGTHDRRTAVVPGPQGYRGVSFAEYRAWQDATTRFVATAAYVQTTMNVTDGERAPERLTGAYVSAETFPLLGQKPIAGRGFVVEDDRPGATPVVILGGSAWRTRYDGRSTVLGRTIRVNGIPSTIVGVMPDGFGFPANAELWQPLALHPAVSTAPRSTRLLNVVGRLADGVTLADAQVELDGIAARLAQEFPDSNTAVHPTVTPYAERHLPPQIRLIFLALMGAVAFVLLIACANVANLLLGRAARRMREVSIRVSLGATRGRIVRQLLIESVVIATISGVAGFALSVLGLRLFHLIIANLGAPPYWISFTMDLRVFAFLAAVCLSTGVVFGLAPALHVSRANVNTRVNEHGRGSGHPRTRWTGAFVVVQVSLTMVLLTGAGYFARSFLDAYRFDPGFDPSGLVRMALVLPQADYPTPETRATFAAQLDARLRRLSSEMKATVTSTAPFQAGDRVQLSLAGVGDADRGRREALVRTIGPDYFTTFNQSLRLGRPFMEQDGGVGREAAIIDERLAALLFPNANPIGARINMTRRTATEPSKAWVTVVGVAPSLPQRNVAVSEPSSICHTEPTRFSSQICTYLFEPIMPSTRL